MKWIPGFLLVLAGCSSGENLQNDKINDGIQTALNECADDVASDRCKALDVAIANAVSDPASQTQAAVLTLLAGNEAFQDGVAESLATGRWNTGSTESDPFVDSVAKQVVDGHGEGLAALIAGELANNPDPYTSFYTELASSITETTESLGALPEAVAQELASTHLTVLAGEVAAASGFASTVAVDVAELITDPEGTYEFISDVTILVAAQVSAEGSALIATLAADDTFIEAVTGTAYSTYLSVDNFGDKLEEYVSTAEDGGALWSWTTEVVNAYVAAAIMDDTNDLWAKTIEVVDAQVDANTDEVSTLGALAAQFQTAADVTSTLDAYTTSEALLNQIDDEIDRFFPSSESYADFSADLAWLVELQDVVVLDRTSNLVKFHGVNVQIVDGFDATVSTSGLGNLIIGYNVDAEAETGTDEDRSGAHNLILGDEHSYSASAGILSGYNHDVSADGAAAIAGYENEVSREYAAAIGGLFNNASGPYALVAGGREGIASGDESVVCGGNLGEASGSNSVAAGGDSNNAVGDFSSVFGGYLNEASGNTSTASGGESNTASQSYTVVSGGYANITSQAYAAAVGGTGNEASGAYAAVFGGANNRATGANAVVNGGQENEASGQSSAVTGGFSNAASYSFASVSGGLDNEAGWVYAWVGGGEDNIAGNSTLGGWAAVVVGGTSNEAYDEASAVIGGASNDATASWCTVRGGQNQVCSSDYSYTP